MGQGQYLRGRYAEVLEDLRSENPKDERSAEEIIEDVIERFVAMGGKVE